MSVIWLAILIDKVTDEVRRDDDGQRCTQMASCCVARAENRCSEMWRHVNAGKEKDEGLP